LRQVDVESLALKFVDSNRGTEHFLLALGLFGAATCKGSRPPSSGGQQPGAYFRLSTGELPVSPEASLKAKVFPSHSRAARLSKETKA
jgi:hypothetical protein